jgi:hypothetical protein
VAAGQEPHDVDLAAREALGVAPEGLRPGLLLHVEEATGHRRVDVDLSPHDGVDRRDELRPDRSLDDVPGRAGRQRRAEDLPVLVDGQDDDPGPGHLLAEQPGQIEPSHPRNREVHENDVGLQLERSVETLVARGGLPDDLESCLFLQKGTEAGADHAVVVHDQDPKRHPEPPP